MQSRIMQNDEVIPLDDSLKGEKFRFTLKNAEDFDEILSEELKEESSNESMNPQFVFHEVQSTKPLQTTK